MMNVEVIRLFDNGDIEAPVDINPISVEIDKEINNEDIAIVTAIRREVTNNELKASRDELFIKENGENIFGGLIKDIDSGNGATKQIVVESFERYARDAKPVEAEINFNDANDSEIIKFALSHVDQLEPGNIETIENEVSLEFNHSSPARIMRRVREITGGEIIYNSDKTVDYVENMGQDKSNITLSPENKNLTRISVNQLGGDSNITHLRMLGNGSGDSQVVAEVVSEEYQNQIKLRRQSVLEDNDLDQDLTDDEINQEIRERVLIDNGLDRNLTDDEIEEELDDDEAEQLFNSISFEQDKVFDEIEEEQGKVRQIWTTYTDSSISDSNTLRKEGESRMEDMTNNQIEVRATVRGPEVNLGDKFNITYTEEGVQNEVLRAVDTNKISDNEGLRYEVTFSPKELTKESADEKIHKDVEKNNRESGESAGLPIYSSVETAPERLSVIFITGEESDERGIYIYDDEEDRYKRGSNSNISELSDRNLRGKNITDGDKTIYSGSSNSLQMQAMPSPLSNISDYPIPHESDVTSPPNAHHPSQKVDVGYIISDPDKDQGYLEFIETGFKPTYVEFYSSLHFEDFGEKFTFEEIPDSQVFHSISNGYSSGEKPDEQFVSNSSINISSPARNSTYISDGEVIYITYTEEDTNDNLVDREIKTRVYSFTEDGFRIQWLKNDFKNPILYKAFR